MFPVFAGFSPTVHVAVEVSTLLDTFNLLVV